jgi:periplasmic protein CpxP/Spy
MNTFLRASAGIAATAALVSAAWVAVAQDQAPPGAGSPPTAEQRAAFMHDRLEARAKALQDVLNLRPDQQAAFQAVQAAMTPPPRGERHEQRDPSAAPLTTPQRLDRMADRMAKHEAEFHRRADAIKAFYAVLSPEQQRAFDALPMMMAGGHRGMGRGPMGGHGPDGGHGQG